MILMDLIDLTSLIANEKSFKVDIDGFDKNIKIQKTRSKTKRNDDHLTIIIKIIFPVVFLRRDLDEVDAKIQNTEKLNLMISLNIIL